jgi:hypothetical protein
VDVDVDTFKRHDYLSQHVVKALGARKVRDLRTREVEAFLKTLATTHATRTIRDIKWCLNTAIRRAMARDLIDRNVVEVAEVPRGMPGRPSKSLTKDQAIGVVTLTKAHWMYPYIIVSLLTGVRTEEMRALRWDAVDLDSTPGTITVLRSVRKTGDTKTQLSRRGLAIAELVVDVLRRHRDAQERLRADAGTAWTETGLVFTTKLGTGLDAANVRRALRSALKLVPGVTPGEWVPRNCATRSPRSCPNTASPTRRSPACSGTPVRRSWRRSTVTSCAPCRGIVPRWCDARMLGAGITPPWPASRLLRWYRRPLAARHARLGRQWPSSERAPA